MAERRDAVELPVFGIPVRFEADDPELIALVEESFGAWSGGESSHTGPALSVRLHRAEGDEMGVGRPEVRVRILPDGRRMILSTAGSFGVADPERGDAFGYLTGPLMADRSYARSSFVEALTLRLMGIQGRVPFHASLVARGDVALLLTGPSGVGKSTLAYVCARGGFRVIAEDVAWVQREPSLRVWGRSDFLHLTPQSVTFFPELEGRPLARRPNQKEKIPVDLRALGAVGVPWAEKIGLCVLSRTGGEPALVALAPDHAARMLSAELDAGIDLFRGDAYEVIRALAAGGCWRLEAGPEPAAALPLLERALERVGSTSAEIPG